MFRSRKNTNTTGATAHWAKLFATITEDYRNERAQARFSTTQQLLFVNSPDLKKQTSCIQIVFFSKKHSSLKMWAV